MQLRGLRGTRIYPTHSRWERRRARATIRLCAGMSGQSSAERPDATGWRSAVRFTGQIAGKSGEVLARCEPLRLEAWLPEMLVAVGTSRLSWSGIREHRCRFEIHPEVPGE